MARKYSKGRGRGWFDDPYEHSLASKGVKVRKAYAKNKLDELDRETYVLRAEGRITEKLKKFAERGKLLSKFTVRGILPEGTVFALTGDDFKEVPATKENVSELTMGILQDMDMWEDSYRDLILSRYPKHEDGDDFVYHYEIQGRLGKKGKHTTEDREHVYPSPKMQGWIHGTTDKDGNIDEVTFRISEISSTRTRNKLAKKVQDM